MTVLLDVELQGVTDAPPRVVWALQRLQRVLINTWRDNHNLSLDVRRGMLTKEQWEVRARQNHLKAKAAGIVQHDQILNKREVV